MFLDKIKGKIIFMCSKKSPYNILIRERNFEKNREQEIVADETRPGPGTGKRDQVPSSLILISQSFDKTKLLLTNIDRGNGGGLRK
ncbi:unnamed protein product [Meloidogyne enterolobii]|uniref:Uncharacterized protein n=1 Tax=Meloidogyne enterolobii TaxID=390850 RepID=A0ACB0Z5M1_MELEN